MNCCGREVKTPFCPHCGKECNSHPLSGLLVHVQGRVNHFRKATERWKKVVENNDKPDGYLIEKQRGFLEKNQRLLDRWQLWLDALEKLTKGKP